MKQAPCSGSEQLYRPCLKTETAKAVTLEHESSWSWARQPVCRNLTGFYEERKELDRNMEEIFQRLSFWTSLEKSNRYLILKEVENALALFELHHQDQELALPKIEISRDQQTIDASSSIPAATLNPDTNSSSSNYYSTCSHQTVSWLYFIIACLLLFILFTGIDFHCPYQIV
ncbi:Oidioi.mRNA.OKI2018_I69.XSR.g13354.t1.cds [Oikopleura dioica]|uniref:Oidioi.mRNA.OKI2018_I69.XSR.g13354.t1.cds n=1 Tax=Oikopleura dioica TaxID=34765 RepID=A0ABN7SF08_OIKDI|nr:Oidioi.mRNA.OKI2018_I69.XSR.g13354.t1.cds [Oikopleura dioica]